MIRGGFAKFFELVFKFFATDLPRFHGSTFYDLGSPSPPRSQVKFKENNFLWKIRSLCMIRGGFKQALEFDLRFFSMDLVCFHGSTLYKLGSLSLLTFSSKIEKE
ncbi:hypothetical protein KSP39_PZI022220 [Platanthera zijinensis]|uniref:Uncharacterized protein n=1 Tax=Platanthera zijinensis TaxID=2320716 RepID=A0AAP0FVJ8_9ASPA